MQGMTALEEDSPIAGNLKTAMMRGLQGAEAPAENDTVTYVTTKEELFAAVNDGKRYIEVREHLNLVKEEIIDTKGRQTMMNINMHTWSIRVRSSCLYSAGSAFFACIHSTASSTAIHARSDAAVVHATLFPTSVLRVASQARMSQISTLLKHQT
jgi:hypothetical protein